MGVVPRPGAERGVFCWRVPRFAGKVVLLEINPNCGIFHPRDAHGSADFILTLDPHACVLRTLCVLCALRALRVLPACRGSLLVVPRRACRTK